MKLSSRDCQVALSFVRTLPAETARGCGVSDCLCRPRQSQFLNTGTLGTYLPLES